MMSIPFLLPLLLLTLIPCLGLCDQGESRSCRILYLSAPVGAPKTLQLFDGESCREVELPRMNLSRVYSLRVGELTLRMLDKSVSDASKVPENVPLVVVPEDYKHIYLVVFHDPKNDQVPVRMAVINANDERIALGEMLWVNYSKSMVSGTIGSQDLKIEAGEESLIKEPAKDRGGYSVEMTFRDPGEDLNRPLVESRWRHDPRSRSIVFITSDGDGIVPSILAFTDYRHASEK